mmetsp:Transcript_35548/g.104081  ORF Transcript_35548/g.104081 Transcript_35548/m.104081 type:complete len:205 (+) Transcript_35548:515-1129(+)
MKDATATQMPVQMRQLCVSLLMYNHVTNPTKLFENHQMAMADAFRDRLRFLFTRGLRSDALDSAILRAMVLFDLEERLLSQGEAGETQRNSLPALTDAERQRVAQVTAGAHEPREIRDELTYDREKLAAQYSEHCANVQRRPSQLAVVDAVIGAVCTERPFCAFLDVHQAAQARPIASIRCWRKHVLMATLLLQWHPVGLPQYY